MQQLDLRRAAVYCGTYRKYNSGSLAGAWINLANYKSQKDFYAKCAEIHKDEKEPEFMFQDAEYLPPELFTESHVCEDYWDVLNEVNKWTAEKESAFCVWLDENGFPADVAALEEFAGSYTATTNNAAKGPIKGLHAEVIEGGIGIVAEEKKYTFMHRKEIKLCGAAWNKDVQQWQATDEESIKKLTDWLAGKLIIDTATTGKNGKGFAKGEKFEGDLQKFLDKQDDWHRDYYSKKLVAAVEVTDGHYLVFEKGLIKKSFCFGYSDFGQGPTREEAIDRYNSVNEKYVYNANMQDWRENEDVLKSGIIYVWADEKSSQTHTECFYSEESYMGLWCKNEYICIKRDEQPEVYSKIVKCFEYAKGAFEKRLSSYLKKYGVSEIKKWTHWADE